MECQNCGGQLDDGDACFRCEVTVAAKEYCSEAEAHTCERCSDKQQCQNLYVTARQTGDGA